MKHSFAISAVYDEGTGFAGSGFGDSVMRRMVFFAYGTAAYVAFLGVVLLLFAFLAGLFRPPMAGAPMAVAIAVDLLLVVLFGLQHSVMARPAFKAWWTRVIPHEMERATYVWATNLVLLLMIALWQPIDVTLWNVGSSIGQGTVLALFVAGWITVLGTTFLINHFDLFGLRHAWLALRGKPYTPVGFRTPGPYKFVRHPLYVGWLMTFWAAPVMTLDRLVFALGMTVYILAAIRWEERDLVAFHGEAYAEYRRRVPMLVPGLNTLVNVGERQPTEKDVARVS